MIFIAHVKIFDEYSDKEEFEQIIYFADDFLHAVSILTNYYGNNLSSIHLLEPIGDNKVIIIDKEIEDAIRKNEMNGF